MTAPFLNGIDKSNNLRGGVPGPPTDPIALLNSLKEAAGSDLRVQTALVTLADVVTNVSSSRLDWLRRADASMDPRRSIDDECGFPKNPSPDAYWDLYRRFGLAARVVEVLPKEAWKVQPTVYEVEDGEEATDFERAWDAIASNLGGTKSWYKSEGGNPIWEYILRADVLSGIGRYGVIVIGLDDGLDLSLPVAGVEERGSLPGQVLSNPDREGGEYAGQYFQFNESALTQNRNGVPLPAYSLTVNRPAPFPPSKSKPKPTAKEAKEPADDSAEIEPVEGETGKDADGLPPVETERKLVYLKVLPEPLAQITTWESNRRSPRFGQPTMYLCTFNDPREEIGGVGTGTGSFNVHWTRVIHLADNRESSDVFGVSRMRAVLNDLLGLRKVYGAGPEGYWKACFTLLTAETHPQLGGQVNVNQAEMKDMWENLLNGLQRTATLQGMTMKSTAPSVTDPTPHLEAGIGAICMKLGVPVPVFKGYEIGEQASENNKVDWNDRLKHHRDFYETPKVIVQVVDRFIMVGLLPEPKEYFVAWPPGLNATDAQKADIFTKRMTAFSTAVSGGVVPTLMDEFTLLTREAGFTDEEAEQIVEAAAKKQEEEQQAAMDEQAMMIEQGLAPDPTAEPPVGPVAVKPGDKLVHPETGKTVADGNPLPKKPVTNKYTFDAEDCPECGASMEGDPDNGTCNTCGHKWGTEVKE